MAKQISGIQIDGLQELQAAFKNLPEEVNASVIRNVARKPAGKVVSKAREIAGYLLPMSDTKRIFKILKVKDLKQKFIEVGISGKSFAYIFMFSKNRNRKKKSGENTGTIKPVGNIVQMAAGEVDGTVMREMNIELSKTIAKAIKRYVK